MIINICTKPLLNVYDAILNTLIYFDDLYSLNPSPKCSRNFTDRYMYINLSSGSHWTIRPCAKAFRDTVKSAAQCPKLCMHSQGNTCWSRIDKKKVYCTFKATKNMGCVIFNLTVSDNIELQTQNPQRKGKICILF